MASANLCNQGNKKGSESKKVFLNRSAIASLRRVRIKRRVLFKTFMLSEYCLVNV